MLPLIFLVGMAQYAMVAIEVIISGDASLWQLESDALNTAGPIRYVKDFFVACLSLAWIIALPKLGLPSAIRARVRIFFFWITGVVIVGSMGFIFGLSPLFFLPAGLRWLLLLNAAFGVFLLSSTLVSAQNRHRFIFRFLWCIVFVDLCAVILQYTVASSLFGIAFGAARLTGLFSNAGVAAFFAIAVALISFQLDGVSLKTRMVMSIVCVFLALSTGTRFATIAIFMILLIQLWEMVEVSGGKLKSSIKLLLVPLFVLALFVGYQALNQQVDRGDAISQQLEKGGRIGNLLESVEMLYLADAGELMIGRGLGIGTNTAIGASLAEGKDPDAYRFNMLTDNAFITCIFQFGILGSLLFWSGIFKFIIFVRPKYSTRAKYRYFGIVVVILLTLISGSPFEHYFLMMSYAASLGAVYWSDRFAYQEIKSVLL